MKGDVGLFFLLYRHGFETYLLSPSFVALSLQSRIIIQVLGLHDTMFLSSHVSLRITSPPLSFACLYHRESGSDVSKSKEKSGDDQPPLDSSL